jgi:hypothetical protein
VAGIQGLAWSEGSYSSEQLRRLNDRLVWGWLPGRGGHVLAAGRHQGGGRSVVPTPSVGICHPCPSVPPPGKKFSSSKAFTAMDRTWDWCYSGWITDSTRPLNDHGESTRKAPRRRWQPGKGVDFSSSVASGGMQVHGAAVVACRKGEDGNPCMAAACGMGG